jgi:hypothetical protein
MVPGKERGKLTPTRVSATVSGEGNTRGGTPAALQVLPEKMETKMRCSRARQR